MTTMRWPYVVLLTLALGGCDLLTPTAKFQDVAGNETQTAPGTFVLHTEGTGCFPAVTLLGANESQGFTADINCDPNAKDAQGRPVPLGAHITAGPISGAHGQDMVLASQQIWAKTFGDIISGALAKAATGGVAGGGDDCIGDACLGSWVVGGSGVLARPALPPMPDKLP